MTTTPVHTRRGSFHSWNDADDAFEKYRREFPRHQEESNFTKVKNAVSGALSYVTDPIKAVRDSKYVRPFSFLGTLGVSTAVVAGVTKTALNAIGSVLYNRSTVHLASHLTKDALISHSYSGLYILIFMLGLYIADSLYKYNTVYMPGKHVSATKLGGKIGSSIIGVSSAIYDVKATILSTIFSNGIANKILMGLSTFGLCKAATTSESPVYKAVFGGLGLYTGYYFIKSFF